ncbi:hypothetical protein E2320_010661 [Naja naja]|nr:hypothetical protein E2320_010661 [Naja naja]
MWGLMAPAIGQPGEGGGKRRRKKGKNAEGRERDKIPGIILLKDTLLSFASEDYCYFHILLADARQNKLTCLCKKNSYSYFRATFHNLIFP